MPCLSIRNSFSLFGFQLYIFFINNNISFHCIKLYTLDTFFLYLLLLLNTYLVSCTCLIFFSVCLSRIFRRLSRLFSFFFFFSSSILCPLSFSFILFSIFPICHVWHSVYYKIWQTRGRTTRVFHVFFFFLGSFGPVLAGMVILLSSFWDGSGILSLTFFLCACLLF